MVMDLAGREYFSFAPDQPMKFEVLINVEDKDIGVSSYFKQLAKEAGNIVTLTAAFPEPNPLRYVLSVQECFQNSTGLDRWVTQEFLEPKE
jgi:hypothetical protein